MEQNPKTKENYFIYSGLYNTDKAFVLHKYWREGVLDTGGERENFHKKKEKKIKIV